MKHVKTNNPMLISTNLSIEDGVPIHAVVKALDNGYNVILYTSSNVSQMVMPNSSSHKSLKQNITTNFGWIMKAKIT